MRDIIPNSFGAEDSVAGAPDTSQDENGSDTTQFQLELVGKRGFDPYRALGLQKNATFDEARVAYKLLLMKWHPDKHQSPDEVTIATRVQQALNGAMEAIATTFGKRAPQDSSPSTGRDGRDGRGKRYKYDDFFSEEELRAFSEINAVWNEDRYNIEALCRLADMKIYREPFSDHPFFRYWIRQVVWGKAGFETQMGGSDFREISPHRFSSFEEFSAFVQRPYPGIGTILDIIGFDTSGKKAYEKRVGELIAEEIGNSMGYPEVRDWLGRRFIYALDPQGLTKYIDVVLGI